MDIWMIWVIDEYSQSLWLSDAWDDESTSENHTGWQEAVDKAVEEHGGLNVRIVKTHVDIDRIRKAFDPVTV